MSNINIRIEVKLNFDYFLLWRFGFLVRRFQSVDCDISYLFFSCCSSFYSYQLWSFKDSYKFVSNETSLHHFVLKNFWNALKYYNDYFNYVFHYNNIITIRLRVFNLSVWLLTFYQFQDLSLDWKAVSLWYFSFKYYFVNHSLNVQLLIRLEELLAVFTMFFRYDLQALLS